MPRVIGFFGLIYVLKSLPRVAAACLLYGVVRVKVGRYILSSEFGLILVMVTNRTFERYYEQKHALQNLLLRVIQFTFCYNLNIRDHDCVHTCETST